MKYKEIHLKSKHPESESLVLTRQLLPSLAPGACQVCLGFDHHLRHHHPHHLHQYFHHNKRILNISVCLSSFDQIYPFLQIMPRQGDHYRHHNHHELFLRWLHMSCTTTFGHRRHHPKVPKVLRLIIGFSISFLKAREL